MRTGSVRLEAFLISLFQTVRVGVKVLRGKFNQLGVFQCLHLVHQPNRDIHAFAGMQFELLDLLTAV